jgi:phage regulator Rha-like protein
MKKALEFKEQFISKHSSLKEEVEDLYQLMLDEIDSGESVLNEINLFISSCEDLIEE